MSRKQETEKSHAQIRGEFRTDMGRASRFRWLLGRDETTNERIFKAEHRSLLAGNRVQDCQQLLQHLKKQELRCCRARGLMLALCCSRALLVAELTPSTLRLNESTQRET